MEIYSGYVKDENELLSTSSGGVATVLSRFIIREGGCVFGVKYTSDFYGTEYCCVNKEEELEGFKGSKYTVSKKGNIYHVLEEQIMLGKKVLYIGLGCDIGAVKKYCEINNIDTTNLYTVDILCHGPAVEGVHEGFVKELEQRYNSKLESFSIRYKKNGWTPFYIRAEFKNGKEYMYPFNKTDYGVAFRNIARPACTKCKFKGMNHKGDLCIGDYWGINQKNPGWNSNGVSIMIVQSEKGQQLLDMLDEGFYIQKEMNPEYVLNHNRMYFESRMQSPYYDDFITDLKKKGLHYAVSKISKEKNYLIKKIIRKMKSLW